VIWGLFGLFGLEVEFSLSCLCKGIPMEYLSEYFLPGRKMAGRKSNTFQWKSLKIERPRSPLVGFFFMVNVFDVIFILHFQQYEKT